MLGQRDQHGAQSDDDYNAGQHYEHHHHRQRLDQHHDNAGDGLNEQFGVPPRRSRRIARLPVATGKGRPLEAALAADEEEKIVN
ncbi:MAG: hypothetical protein ACM3KD_10450 [Hyphomicrobiaceae bacterium]